MDGDQFIEHRAGYGHLRGHSRFQPYHQRRCSRGNQQCVRENSLVHQHCGRYRLDARFHQRTMKTLLAFLLLALPLAAANVTNLVSGQSLVSGQNLSTSPSAGGGGGGDIVPDVGWWKFNGDATDSSGNGNNGTTHGSPSFGTANGFGEITLASASSQDVTTPLTGFNYPAG